MKKQDQSSIEQLQFFEDEAATRENKVIDEEVSLEKSQAIYTKDNETAKAESSVVSDTTTFSTIQSMEEIESQLKETQQSSKNDKKGNKSDRKETNLLIEVLDVIRTIVVCFFISWIIATYIAKPIRIDGTSMYPTLHHADHGFSNIVGMHIGEMKRFEVVVVYEPHLDDFVIKRIIALPGETIAYKDNQLYIDGAIMDEPFFNEEYRTNVMTQTNNYFTNDFSEVTLGDNEYFIMGDNRPKSSDSREYGPITKDQIISRGTLVLYPLNRIGLH